MFYFDLYHHMTTLFCIESMTCGILKSMLAHCILSL